MVKLWWSDPGERVKDGHLCYLVLIFSEYWLLTKNTVISRADKLCKRLKSTRHPLFQGKGRAREPPGVRIPRRFLQVWPPIWSKSGREFLPHTNTLYTAMFTPSISNLVLSLLAKVPGQPPLRLSVCGMEVGRPVRRFEWLSRNWKRDTSA